MTRRDPQRSFFFDVPEPTPVEPPRPVEQEPASSGLCPVTAIAPPETLAGQKVYVVDAHSLIHQVFHALPEMTGPAGQAVGAIYGFARDLLYLLDAKRPDYLFCAFDLPGKTFRHELYTQYKAHRPAMHEDLAPQIAAIYRLIDALGIPGLGCESFEADDLLATIAGIVDRLGGECYLVTADKDSRQLLTDRVKIYNIRKNEVIDRAVLAAQWGIAPEQVVDYQALVGDASDNVPGVPQIGPKLAQQLLEKYGTLEGILDHAGEISGPKRRQNLMEGRELALLSRQLVRLRNDVPCPIDWPAGRPGRIDRPRLVAMFREFGFRNMIEKFDALPGYGNAPAVAASSVEGEPASEPAVPRENQATQGPPAWHVVDTPEALAQLAEHLGRQTRIAVDLETTNVWPRWAEIVGYALAAGGDEAWYVPVRAPEGEKHLDPATVREALRPVLENPSVEKVGQNLKYDMLVLRGAGVDLAGVAFDTMLASYLLEAGERNHSLDDLAQRYLHYTTTKISELIGAGKNQKRMDEVPVERVARYACDDAVLPLRLRSILQQDLDSSQLTPLYESLEMPLVEVLVEMEYHGIRIDPARLAELSTRFGQRMLALEDQIYQLAGRPFNIASPKQLGQVLFEDLKLPVVAKTKTGPSTDADVLEELALVHPLPAKILEFRQYAKLKNTYVDALPQMVHPVTGRVHASFHQAVAATGRLSSSDPNLQNIPIRTEAGREIRSAFIAGQEGWQLLAADYSQIELRVLAHYSGDQRLREAFARDEDIHAQVAARINSIPLSEVNESQRRQAKIVNFGVIYGQSPFGLAKQLGIPKEEAARFINTYFEGYPGIDGFLNRVLAECHKTGYVSTLLGRRRAIRGVRPDAGRQRNLPERTAINTVIQGSAADLIKQAMIAIYRRLRQERLSARMLLQIHDELVFEVASDQVAPLAELVTEEMTSVSRLSVPLKVDVKVGQNWADAKRLALR